MHRLLFHQNSNLAFSALKLKRIHFYSHNRVVALMPQVRYHGGGRHSHGSHGHSHGHINEEEFLKSLPPPFSPSPSSTSSAPIPPHTSGSSSASASSPHSTIAQDNRSAQWAINAGAASNLILAGVKAVGGVYTGSAALTADAVHSLADLGSDLISAIAYRISRLGPDAAYPYGKGRAESFGAFLVSASLVLAGGHLGWEAVQSVLQLVAEGGWQKLVSGISSSPPSLPPPPLSTAVEGGLGSGSAATSPLAHPSSILLTDPVIGGIAASVAILSVAVKEGLYRWSMSLARRLRSTVLAANAWHHRSDALSSVVAAVGVGGTALGIPALDPLAAAVVAIMIIQQGATMCVTSVQELLDKRLDNDTLQAVGNVILTSEFAKGDDITTFRRLRARRMGPVVLVDMELGLRPTLTLSAAHRIADDIRDRVLGARAEVADVLIHTFPDDSKSSVFCADDACKGGALGNAALLSANAALSFGSHDAGITSSGGSKNENHQNKHHGDMLHVDAGSSNVIIMNAQSSHHDDVKVTKKPNSGPVIQQPVVVADRKTTDIHKAEDDHTHHHHGHSHGAVSSHELSEKKDSGRHTHNTTSSSSSSQSTHHHSTTTAPGSSSPSALEASIRKLVLKVRHVKAITHLRLHYIPSVTTIPLSSSSSSSNAASSSSSSSSNVRVEMEVMLDDEAALTHSLAEAVEIVKEVRKIVESLPEVQVADVHLEVDPV